jgi:alpha-tubulin suppressor-like RCC1 family protein
MCGRSCAAGERCEGGVCRRSGSLWVTARGAFARFPDGSLRAWGDNSTGQLGDGTMVSRSTPSPTMAPADAEEIVGGAFHTCARLTDGTVSCWGSHRGGQLGLGPISTTPVLVPTRVPGLTGVVSLAAGPYHTCAVRGDGVVLCWGGGGDRFSPLAAGHAMVVSTPTPVPRLSGTFVAVVAGVGHSCARRAGGAVFCWGLNVTGQLGAGTTSGVGPSMVQGLTAAEVSSGHFHSCARLADGSVRCWGYNGYGQLGDGTATNRATPVAFRLPGPAEEVQIGGAFTCARLRTGAVQCAGYNMFGGIGDGTNAQRATPTAVRGITDAIALSSHSGAHTCVRLAAGGIRCWGDNRYGQLGDGTTTNRSAPTAVSGT